MKWTCGTCRRVYTTRPGAHHFVHPDGASYLCAWCWTKPKPEPKKKTRVQVRDDTAPWITRAVGAGATASELGIFTRRPDPSA